MSEADIERSEPEMLDEGPGYFVFNKPPFWHSSGESQPEEPSLQDWLIQSYPSLEKIPEAGLVHRLDYLTSGCVLVARSESEQRQLREALRNDEIKKIYWALARKALPSQGQFELSFESRYKSSRKISVSRMGDSQQKGRCRWRKLGAWKLSSSSLTPPLAPALPEGDWLEVELVGPGKRHQIRAGLAFLGAELFGDPLYGQAHPWGLGLHARELRLSPERRIQAPCPDFWKNMQVPPSRD